MSDETLADRLAIRDVVENWAIARDSADWALFREQWHDDGYMVRGARCLRRRGCRCPAGGWPAGQRSGGAGR